MKPAVTIIVAIDRNRAIGRRGDLIYRIREDLRHFKATTMGHPVIMGRNTWQSLPHALPGRRNIVVSTNPDFSAPGAETATSLADAIALASAAPDGTPAEEIFIIGGARLYAAAIPVADRLIVTEIDYACSDADTFFPPIPADFAETARTPLGTTPSASIVTLTRRS